MRALIRFITRNAAGSLETNERSLSVAAITMGRATDQVLHLRDRSARLHHAQIEANNGDVQISSSTLAGITINGRSQRSATLRVGDVIEVGSNILRVIEAPPGVDFACTFELKPDVGDVEVPHAANIAAEVGFSKRKLSWIAALLVLLLALAVPALSLFGGAEFLRSSPLPDDSLWLAGPVHNKHASIATQCDACHVSAFERVPDTACAACHDAAPHSADAQILGVERCASCHLEHNEPPALVNSHQGLCSACHSSDLPGLENASDFGSQHPTFQVSLLQPNARGDFETVRLPLQQSRQADNSNLKFDHAAHLDPAGIQGIDGKRVLSCGNCHQVETGGGRMAPISMDANCSSCHTLSFDPNDPTRTVPHGDPPAVFRTLTEYYSAQLLGGDSPSSQQRLLRPGRSLSREDRDRVAAEAKSKALSVAEDLFERRACSTCHTIERRQDDTAVPWTVLPVKLTPAFFPLARFTHAAHNTEVSTCDGCHNASSSNAASDVLMPGLESCRDCHGGAIASRNKPGQTPSTCITCHQFHNPHKAVPAAQE